MTIAETALEFDCIKEQLASNAYSQRAKQRLMQLSPYMSEEECIRHIGDTTSARVILDAQGSPPLPFMSGLDEMLKLCDAGAMLLPEQLDAVMQFAASCRRVQRYLAASGDERIAPYGGSIMPLDELAAEIERCIRHNAVDSHASTALHGLRRQMENTRQRIKEKLNSLLANNRKWFSDSYVVQRNGRQVLPVKREYKNNVNGTVVEISSSHSTYFIEPGAVRKLMDQQHQLELEEDAEVRRILYTLTALVEDSQQDIRRNMEIMEQLDFIFAKARLSQQMQAVPAEINTAGRLDIKQGRHPLLDKNCCVPLDFSIGDVRGVIITGPNTGGKTVAIKTVGLLSMMAQSGLHIPAAKADVCMHSGYYCDIGDSQSISANLSTFSGHMTNIIDILQQIGNESLVLLDELGSGTDPAEGMGIAIAVLDELRNSGCMFLVTTHYPEVKEYAEATDGVMSARMAFDRETLSPLYRLELGQSGESCALYIAQLLGLPTHILRRAHAAAYTSREGSNPCPVPELDLSGSEELPRQVRKPLPAIRRMETTKPNLAVHAYTTGDSVCVKPDGETGIVYRPADDMGMVCVQIKGEKRMVNHKRIELKQPAAELYPEGYDMSIIFDSVDNRKASKKMTKRHVPGLQVTYDE